MKKTLLTLRIILCYLLELPQFIIKIENGKAKKVKGTVKNSFYAECNEIAKLHHLNYGFIYAVQGGYGNMVLKGSAEIKKDTLQQLRNVWSFGK